jgi:hypothetical protein
VGSIIYMFGFEFSVTTIAAEICSNARTAADSASKSQARRECVLNRDFGRKGKVPDYAARLEVPLWIDEGSRRIAIQLNEFPDRLPE